MWGVDRRLGKDLKGGVSASRLDGTWQVPRLVFLCGFGVGFWRNKRDK